MDVTRILTKIRALWPSAAAALVASSVGFGSAAMAQERGARQTHQSPPAAGAVDFTKYPAAGYVTRGPHSMEPATDARGQRGIILDSTREGGLRFQGVRHGVPDSDGVPDGTWMRLKGTVRGADNQDHPLDGVYKKTTGPGRDGSMHTFLTQEPGDHQQRQTSRGDQPRAPRNWGNSAGWQPMAPQPQGGEYHAPRPSGGEWQGSGSHHGDSGMHSMRPRPPAEIKHKGYDHVQKFFDEGFGHGFDQYKSGKEYKGDHGDYHKVSGYEDEHGKKHMRHEVEDNGKKHTYEVTPSSKPDCTCFDVHEIKTRPVKVPVVEHVPDEKHPGKTKSVRHFETRQVEYRVALGQFRGGNFYAPNTSETIINQAVAPFAFGKITQDTAQQTVIVTERGHGQGVVVQTAKEECPKCCPDIANLVTAINGQTAAIAGQTAATDRATEQADRLAAANGRLAEQNGRLAEQNGKLIEQNATILGQNAGLIAKILEMSKAPPPPADATPQNFEHAPADPGTRQDVPAIRINLDSAFAAPASAWSMPAVAKVGSIGMVPDAANDRGSMVVTAGTASVSPMDNGPQGGARTLVASAMEKWKGSAAAKFIVGFAGLLAFAGSRSIIPGMGTGSSPYQPPQTSFANGTNMSRRNERRFDGRAPEIQGPASVIALPSPAAQAPLALADASVASAPPAKVDAPKMVLREARSEVTPNENGGVKVVLGGHTTLNVMRREDRSLSMEISGRGLGRGAKPVTATYDANGNITIDRESLAARTPVVSKKLRAVGEDKVAQRAAFESNAEKAIVKAVRRAVAEIVQQGVRQGAAVSGNVVALPDRSDRTVSAAPRALAA